jgi:protein-tyrosine phosphatase
MEPPIPGAGYNVEAKKFIYFPVHDLLRNRDAREIVETFRNFNEAIWEGLQSGNVFCHCLAGVHRAACVAVSHYLWRYYKLGHTHLTSDIAKIYKSLSSRRAGVAALGYLELVKVWEAHLRSQ